MNRNEKLDRAMVYGILWTFLMGGASFYSLIANSVLLLMGSLFLMVAGLVIYLIYINNL